MNHDERLAKGFRPAAMPLFLLLPAFQFTFHVIHKTNLLILFLNLGRQEIFIYLDRHRNQLPRQGLLRLTRQRLL
jgi:hypothetical protein